MRGILDTPLDPGLGSNVLHRLCRDFGCPHTFGEHELTPPLGKENKHKRPLDTSAFRAVGRTQNTRHCSDPR